VPTGPRSVADDFRELEESSYLLLAKDETTWLTRKAEPDRQVEKFLSLGCGVQGIPHLMLDSVAVLEALGVSFVAGGGRQFCCGNPYRADVTNFDSADRLTAASVDRMLAWGSAEVVHWCTACQLTFGAWARGEDEISSRGGTYPLRTRKGPSNAFGNVHVHEFLVRRIRELGAAVPWKKEVRARVLIEGHPDLSAVHDVARSSGAELLSLIPGVEVIGYVDPPSYFHEADRMCTRALTEMTAEDVKRARDELAEQANTRGADMVSCQHHNCHRTWSRFSSERLAVRQCVSVVAEALGVAHPDRYQAAAKIGDARAIVAHTRPLWSSWGIDEARATVIAQKLFDPKYIDRPRCACGGDISRCSENLVVQVQG
jgi:hypothetical protein